MDGNLSLAEIEAFDSGAKGKGRERRFCCPLCHGDRKKSTDHRSLALNVDTGAWRCWRCHATGLIVEKWTDRPPVPRKKATPFSLPPVKPAAAVDAEPLPWAQNFHNETARMVPICGTASAAYLEARGIPAELAARCRIKHSPKCLGIGASVVFPLYNADRSQLLGLHARSVATTDKRTKNAREGGEKGGFHALEPFMPGQPTLLVEAPICALSLAVCGVSALATNGTSCPPWLIRALRLRRVLIGFDRDDAGDKGADSLGAVLIPSGSRCERLKPPASFKDWNDALRGLGREKLSDLVLSAIPELADPFHDA